MNPSDKHQGKTLDDDEGRHEAAPRGLSDDAASARTESIHPTTTNNPQSGVIVSLHKVQPVSVRLEHLSVTVDGSPASLGRLFSMRKTVTEEGAESQTKTILDDISAEMPSGSLTAIIGGSGSGKTSLLNQMSGRMHGSRLSSSGKTLFNGSEDASRVQSAYVIQQDILLSTLTVRETLTYAADLRLPSSISRKERKRLVEEVILELSLKEAADTRVGNSEHRGCSGGEKRRTSIGVQLLSNPSLLWLDEPTTGLDSTSAYQIVKTLRALARQGRTIILTSRSRPSRLYSCQANTSQVHQPRSEIWGLFDRIILLTKGSPAYVGCIAECLPYFASLGHELPSFVNPAEYLIDIVSIDNRSSGAQERARFRVARIKSAWKEHCAKALESSTRGALQKITMPSESSLRHKHVSLLQQIRVLTARTFTVTIRDPMGVFGSLVEAISMGIITGWIFLQLDGSLAGIRSRQGALYIACALQGYLILLYETYRLTTDIQLYDEEARQGVVTTSGFLISRRLAHLLIEDIPVPLIFSLISYFMEGFRPDGSQLMTFFSVMLIQQFIAVNFATLCIAVSRHFAGVSEHGPQSEVPALTRNRQAW